MLTPFFEICHGLNFDPLFFPLLTWMYSNQLSGEKQHPQCKYQTEESRLLSVQRQFQPVPENGNILYPL